jgi:uncharacterized protein YbaR (Trm112 family)
MSDDINDSQIIQCPFCKAPLTVEELGEYVNANPETKKQAIAEEIELWGDGCDRNYLIQNVVFCPSCGKVSHYKDWDSDNNSRKVK